MKHLGTQGLHGTVGKLHSSNGCCGEHPRLSLIPPPSPTQPGKASGEALSGCLAHGYAPSGSLPPMTEWRDRSIQRPGPFTSIGTTLKDFPSSNAPFRISRGHHCSPISSVQPCFPLSYDIDPQYTPCIQISISESAYQGT